MFKLFAGSKRNELILKPLPCSLKIYFKEDSAQFLLATTLVISNAIFNLRKFDYFSAQYLLCCVSDNVSKTTLAITIFIDIFQPG